MPTSIKRVVAWAGLILLGLVLLVSAGWGVLALLYFRPCESAASRLFGNRPTPSPSLAALAGFVQRRWRWRALGAYLALFAIVLVCWEAIPRRQRSCLGRRKNAVIPYATFAGDLVTIHNIRNFDYRTETDFTPAYYARTFDLRQLDSVDLLAVYWMGPAIAHVFFELWFRGRKSRGDIHRGAQ